MREQNPNRLLVEGDEDTRVIPQLIEANGIPWGERRGEWIVEIKAADGVANLLRPGKIKTELADRTVKRLGILLDANDHPAERWQSLRNECGQVSLELPETPPGEGTIVRTADSKSLGIWLMPDNQSRGMLETFLAHLVPDGLGELWAYAREAVAEARSRAAAYRDTHRDKAAIHTWLAWQDPPGCQLHHAVLQRILDPRSPLARPFVDWFRRLYEL
jgi:hypothetical protein